jgi:hypothetical protein
VVSRLLEAISKIEFWFNPPEADKDRGGAEFQTAGILLYVEDLKRGTNPAEKGVRPKDIFEIASRLTPHRPCFHFG